MLSHRQSTMTKFRPASVYAETRVCGLRVPELLARAILGLHGFLSFANGMLYLVVVALWKLRGGQAIINAAYALSIVPESMKVDKKDFHYDNKTNPVSDMGPALNTIFYYVLGIGVVMAAYGIVVFIAACSRNRVLLILFAIFAIFQLALNTVYTGLLFSGQVNGAFKLILNNTLQEFRGIDTTEINSVMWNYGQIEMKCCGLNNYTDFQYTHAWRKHRIFDVQGRRTVNRTLNTPMACCKFIGEIPKIAPVNTACSYKPSRDNSNLNKGCWEVIQNKAMQHRGVAIGLCSAILIWELLVFLLTLYLIRALRRYRRMREKSEDTKNLYSPVPY